MNCVRGQKNAALKDLREIIRVLKKVEKENKVVICKLAEKVKSCLIEVSVASYSKKDRSVGGENLMIAN